MPAVGAPSVADAPPSPPATDEGSGTSSSTPVPSPPPSPPLLMPEGSIRGDLHHSGAAAGPAEGLLTLQRLPLDEHYKPRKNLISLYTEEERESLILDVILDLKVVDVEVRVNETKKSITIAIPFEDRKGCKKKELVMSAVELLNGYLPGRRVDAATASRLSLTPRPTDGGGPGASVSGGSDAGVPQTHWKVFRERTFTFASPVIMLSTRRKEKDKERREFETPPRLGARARAIIPTDGVGMMPPTLGGATDDMGPAIVCFRDDLVENDDVIDEVEDFRGQWSIRALCCRRGAKCNKLSMFCARLSGKKASREYTALYELCEKMGIVADFTSRYLEWSAYNVKPQHSLPGVRLMVFGWQPTIDHMDFAGILNANALYSFTIGVPQLGFALFFLLAKNQESLVVFSTIMSGLSIVLSLANICCNFPKHLRKIAEKKAEQARDHLDAMRSTQTTVTRLQEEAFNEKKHRFELAQNDDEGYKYFTPSRVLDDVMKVEWNLMVNEVDVMWQQMHRTQLKNKARKDAKEGVDPFKNRSENQHAMLRRVPYFAGSNRAYEYPDIEAFQKSGPLRSPNSSWQMQLRQRDMESMEVVVEQQQQRSVANYATPSSRGTAMREDEESGRELNV